jgi:hypothetical protein
VNELTTVSTLTAAVLLLILPRHLAGLPLVLAASGIAGVPLVEVGPASFTVLRILVAVGVVRLLIRSESISHGLADVDRYLVLWAVWLLGTSVFHVSGTFVFRAGLVWDQLGAYFLLRAFLRERDDVVRVVKALCLGLVPVALLMMVEQATGQNAFSVFGGTGEVAIRDGVVRARGPFAHPILAGTVGATCLPMALSLWRQRRTHAILGIAATTAMILASRSSGPVLMAAFAVGGIVLWRVRQHLATIRWLVLAAVVALHLVMKAPVYFLIARIDVIGGSQGWHRAQLIHESLRHLDEWWLVGTDYTRHWMPTGIYANEVHTDITNHFIYQGVHGGLLLVALFVAVLVAAFRAVGRFLALPVEIPVQQRHLAWVLGATLAAHVMNFTAITLFDQSIVFFYLVLAAIGVTRKHAPAALPRPASALSSAPAGDPRGSAAQVPTLPADGRRHRRADAWSVTP